MARRTDGTDAPRTTVPSPSDLEPWTPGPGDVLSGDRIEGKRIVVLDLAGERVPDLELEESVVESLRAGDADLRGLRIRDTWSRNWTRPCSASRAAPGATCRSPADASGPPSSTTPG